MSKEKILLFLFIAVVVIAGCACDKPDTASVIKMATTTSTENSGLLDVLLPFFKKESNIEVQVIAVGTGKAIKHGENGDVDLIFVHAREAEDEFVEKGFGVNRKDVMYNDFVIIGPEADPAGIRDEKTAAGALERIAKLNSIFISRGDKSGTHKKEQQLWKQVT